MFLGLTQKEKSRFSIVRLINAQLTPNARNAAPYEFEVIDTLRDRIGPSTLGGLPIPDDVLFARTMVTSTAAAGGYLKPTDVPAFHSALNESSWLYNVNLQTMTGLSADLKIPRHTANFTSTWLDTETSSGTAATPDFGLVSFAPKTNVVILERSRHHLIQAPQQEAQLQRDLGLALGYSVAAACANGAGSGGVPTGALTQITQNVSGSALSSTGVAEMLRLVEVAGADQLTALVGPAAAKLLRVRERASGNGFVLQGGKLMDVPCIVSNTMPTDAAIVGDFRHALYAGWGPTVEVVATQLSSAANFQSGIVSIRAITSMDFGLLHPNAFCKSTSIT